MNNILLLLMFLFFIGCKSEPVPQASSTVATPTENLKKINNLRYEKTNFLFRKEIELIVPFYPTYYGSIATNFTVFPQLPTGLFLSSLSGRIAGTPEQLLITPTTYTITASNEHGNSSVNITIQILEQEPFGLRYNTDEINLIKNISDISLFPISNDGVRGGAKISSFSIFPALPEGLAFNSQTGSIEGIALNSFPLTSFTITGYNTGGSVQTIIPISSSSSLSTIVAGGKHTCAIVDEQIQCWGDNKYGQLGTDPLILPMSNIGFKVPFSFSPIRKVLLGSELSCVAQTDAKLFCFGKNQDNQLGSDALLSLYYSPTFITDLIIDGSLSKHGYEKIGSFAHACSTSNGGYGYCAGQYPFGDLSAVNFELRSASPVAPVPLISVITSGSNFTCFTSSQKAYCLGDNFYGQLGDNQAIGLASTLGVTPTGLESGVNAISAGKNFACAIKSNKVYCWGDNLYGQLGNSSFMGIKSLVPIEVLGLPSNQTISSIATGNDFACALSQGEAYCWGDNFYGQLGINTTDSNSLIPVKLKKQDSTDFGIISQITAGEEHICIQQSNQYYCAGRNDKGQLGNNSIINSRALVPVILSN